MNQPINYFDPKEFNPHEYPTTPEIAANLDELHDRMNQLRSVYGKPMQITSGLRSQEQQTQLIAEGKSNAPKSKHLTGQAVDILDKTGELGKWTFANVEVLKDIGLWCEDLSHTPGWVHYQCVPPKSGKRFFIP